MIDVEADYPPAFLDQSLRATLPHQSEADKPHRTHCMYLPLADMYRK